MLVDPASTLREHGIYVTAQRLAVLRAVGAHPHSTADTIAQQVRDEIGTVSRQSVYDTLSALTERGLLRRFQPMGSPARYEDRTGDNHHHLICRTCGMVVDIDCAVGARPCLTAGDDAGFVIDEAEVIFWGHCTTCRTDAATPTAVTAAVPTTATRTTTSSLSSTHLPNHHKENHEHH